MNSTVLDPYSAGDQVNRNLLATLYNTKTSKLNAVKQDAYDQVEHNNLTTTYREDLLNYGRHGSLVGHYGNNTNDDLHSRYPKKYLNESNSYASTVKPFLAPSYHNLTQNKYMLEERWHHYSNNYLTSDDNVCLKQLDVKQLPQKTKLKNFFKISFKPIANVDEAEVYAQEKLNGYVNDYFVSKKQIKTEINNIKEKFAEAMQLADYLRNKRSDAYVRKLFSENSNNINFIDLFADMFTRLITEMQNLLRHTHLLDYHAVGLRKMFENLTNITGKVLNSNLTDRKTKPMHERQQNMKTEKALIENKTILLENKDFANKTLAETQMLLNTMKLISSEFVNKVLEEAKCIFMEKLDNQNYQKIYIRDSNGYIRKDAKRALELSVWLKLANDLITKTKIANKNAEKLTKILVDEMDGMSSELSYQWMKTHDVVKDQLINNDLVQNDILIDQQRECKREILELKENIDDTRRRMNTAKTVNEVNLTQLQKPMPNIDMIYDNKRFDKINRTNRVWSSVTALRNNLTDMQKYKELLDEKRQMLDKRIQSSQSGINYDYRTIENPRKHANSVQASIDLSSKTYATFY